MFARTRSVLPIAGGTPAALSTGLPGLDACLPGRGWPPGQLVEILCAGNETAALDLVTPALNPLLQRGRRIALVNPPTDAALLPLNDCPPRPGSVVRMHPQSAPSHWGVEQCLQAGACDAVLAWLPQADYRQLRSVQEAARGTHALCFAIRGREARDEPSPAAVRIDIFPFKTGSCVELLKCNLIPGRSHPPCAPPGLVRATPILGAFAPRGMPAYCEPRLR